MARKKKQMAEFRYYSLPPGNCILALLGEKWVQHYGRGIDYLHFHNYLEIGYCYSGNGMMTLGKEDLKFTGGEVTVIPSRYLHTTNSAEDTVSRWEYLFVDVEGILKKHLKDNPVRLEKMIKRINSRALFRRDRRLAEPIIAIMEIIRNEKEYYQEQAEGIMFAFLAEVARINAETDEKFSDKIPGEGMRSTNGVIARALEYISDHYNEQIKVSDIAREFHISETHFRRMFEAYMHLSPLEYINLVRIQTACEYLKKTDETIADIAAKCGYTTLSTFNRNFSRITGTNPAEWRKNPVNYELQILEFDIHSEEGW